MTSLLGCYLQCGFTSNKDVHMVEGPLFTVGKKSKNGDRIPPSEAEAIKKSLVGAPIRYCPKGFDWNGVTAAHYCDLVKDDSSKIGEVTEVYTKPDNMGREIVYARGSFKAGVNPETLPTAWSIFANIEQRDEDDNVYGAKEPSISILDNPAFEEARTHFYSALQAGTVSKDENTTFKGLNSSEDIKGIDTSMPNDTTTPAQTGTTPIVQTTEQAKPLVTTTPVVETPKPIESISKADLEKILAAERERTIAETKEQMQRERLASEIAEKRKSLGLIKPEDVQQTFDQYMKFQANDLQFMLNDLEAISKVAASARKSTEITGKDIAATSPALPEKYQSEKFKRILSSLGSSPEIFQKQMNEHRF